MSDVLRAALDATPLIGRPTGVGGFCSGLLTGLGRREDVDALAFAVSWRRRHAIVGRVPPGVAVAGRAMPARPLHAAWRRSDFPPIEWFVGPVDVVHGTNYVVPPTRRAGRVVSVHDLTTVRFPEICTPATLAFPALIRRAAGQGAWILTLTRAVAAEVVDVLGVDAGRVRAVHPAFPPLPPPDPQAAARHVPSGASRYVLAVGTAEPRKDLPGLVTAFDAIAGGTSGEHDDLALVLAGPEGWGSEQLRKAIAATRASDRISITGWVDDATLAGLLSGATALAYPSLYEGFGFPPLQAMNLGTPVVATAVAAVEEVLGDAALLVPPRDPPALAQALASVVDTAGLAADLSSRGRECAAAYDWDRCAAGVTSVYAEAVADVRSARSPGVER